MITLTPAEIDALLLSLRISGVAVACALPLAVLTATALALGRFPGRFILDACVHLPLILPPVVTGYLLLVVFGRQGVVGGWLHEWLGITLAFRWTGAVLAGAIVGFPLMVRAVRLSIEAVDRRLEGAAMVLGARPLRVFLTVTLPLASPGIIAGALLAFARALGEFGATITFVSNIPGETRTLPIAIYTYLQIPGGEGAAGRLVLLSVVLALAALLASEWLARSMRRRLEAG